MFGKEKDRIFRKCDVFIFPTYYKNECFPLVLLEAMQYKLPVITTDEGGIPDIVINNQNGIICNSKDVQSLTNAIEKLIKDKELCTSLSKEGYRIFKEKYSLKTFEENFCNIVKNNIAEIYN